MTDEIRRWTFEDEPRLDNDGTEWYACDPYPTWFYWTGEAGSRKLITTDERQVFYDNRGGEDWIDPTPFPGWAD